MREARLETPRTSSGRSAPLSTEPHARVSRAVPNSSRSQRIKNALLPWCITLILLSAEVFIFGSSIGIVLVGESIPTYAIVVLEYVLLLYVSGTTLWMIYELICASFKKGLMHAGLSMIIPSPQTDSKLLHDTSSLLDTSNRTDCSWVDDHHFGMSTEDSPVYSRLAFTTTDRSALHDFFHEQNVRTRVSQDVGISSNVVMPRSSPYSKSIDSIHTREQLEFLISKDSSLHMDSSSSRNGSYTYFDVLDIGAPEDRKGYQISEPLMTSDSKENIVVKIGPRNHMMISPASSEGDGQDEMTRLRHTLQHARHSPRKTGSILRRSDSVERRRRSVSFSSPERQTLATGSGTVPTSTEIDSKTSCLRDADLVRGEQRLRAWLVNTIFEPLHVRIKETNSTLDKEHTSPPLRIGVSSVDALQNALISRPELLDTMLPYILPFLHGHANQSYLVSRISELSSDKFMMEYSWNSGGREPLQDRVSSSRVARRPWSEHLPTDAVLVFSLFSAYMDSQLTSTPLVGSCRLAQPFSALYTLKTPQRPSAVHLAPESFYLHMSNSSPPHFDFVFNDGDGSPSRAAIPRGQKNLFYAILSFLNHAKINNGGRLDRMSIGRTGLNIACVLD